MATTLGYSVEKINITQPFGADNSNHPVRNNFYTLFDNKHPGVDFKLSENTKITTQKHGF